MGPLLEFLAGVAELVWAWVLFTYLKEEDDPLWRTILIVGNFPAAIAYLLIRHVPVSELPLPAALRRLNLRQKINDARASARYIGGALQYVELARLLQSVELFKEAYEAYNAALAKEPADPDALWGVATLELKRGRKEAARAALEALLKVAPDYGTGKAALLRIRLLIKNDEFPAAEAALRDYLPDHGEPEGRYYLARLLLRRQETDAARKLLEELVTEVGDSAPALQIRDYRWMKAAEKVLAGLRKR